MGPPSGARRSLVAAGLALVGLCFVVPPDARAVDSVPPEPGIRVLDGPSLDGLVADLNGDGRAELIRLTPWSPNPDELALDIWREGRGGAWVSAGQVPIMRRITLEERADQPPGQPQLLPATLSDGARLLRYRRSGRDEVLVAVTHDPGSGQPTCCLTAWTVGLRNGVSDARPAFAEDWGASAMLAIDLNADGTDELVVREDGQQGHVIHLLHWEGRAFTDSSVRQDPGDPGTLTLLGDTDGRPGEEASLAGAFQGGTGGVVYGLMRVSMRDGRIHVEQEEVDRPGLAVGVPASDGSRGLIAFGNDESALALLDWPSDGTPRVASTVTLHGEPIAVLGSGPGQRIVVRSVEEGLARYRLIDSSLHLASIQPIPPSPAAAPLLADAFAPYAGPWLPGAAGTAGPFVVVGRPVTVDTAGQVAIGGQIAALSGAVPLGLLGDSDEIALMQTLEGDAFAPVGLPRDRGGELLASQPRRIAIVPRVLVETPERDGGHLTPGVLDAVRDPSAHDASSLLIEAPAFVAALDAPIGSIARTDAEGRGAITVLDPDTVPPDLGTTGGAPFRVEIVWRSCCKPDKPFTATLTLTTPAGHAYTATWRVRLLPSRPRISASGDFLSLGFGAGLSGQVDAGSTVTVDGRTIQTDAFGHFATNAPGGVLPRDAQVVATDPFGRRTTIKVSVVAPIDYRRLPWIPIAAVGTIAAGFLLYVRAPRARPRSVIEAQPTDGVLEEIDGDR